MQKVKIHVKKIDGLKLPVKNTEKDACYDVFATSGPFIKGDEIGGGIYSEIDYIEYGTNLFIAPQQTLTVFDTYLDYNDWWIQGLPRSSISKYNLIMANSCPTLDNGFRGQIMVRFKYLVQMSDITIFDGHRLGARVNLDKCYKANDKIMQIRPVKNIGIDWVLVDDLDKTERNKGGFGSSGQ
jgi:dUTPase